VNTTIDETRWYRAGTIVIPPPLVILTGTQNVGVTLTLLKYFNPLVFNVPDRKTKEGFKVEALTVMFRWEFHIKPARPERERHPATTNIETPPIPTFRWEFHIKRLTPPENTTKVEA
jgi:hypothetical protein